MAPPLYSAEWNATCAKRPLSMRNDAEVSKEYFNFNYFIMAFALFYYLPPLIVFYYKKRSSPNAYLANRSFSALILAALGCISIVIVGPVRDIYGRQEFPCSATLWLRLIGVANVILPVLVRLNFFRQKMEWSRAMKNTNVQKLQTLARIANNGQAVPEPKHRPSIMGMLFGHTPTNSPTAPVNISDEFSESGGTPSVAGIKERESKSVGGNTPSGIHEVDKSRIYSSSSGMDSKEFAALLYRRSIRYNLIAIGLPLLPLVITGLGIELGLPYYRGNCNGCFEEMWIFFIIMATVAGVINMSAFYAYQLRNSPDPLFMLHELKMLVLTASLPGSVGAILTALDQFIGRIYDRGIFSWDWLVLLALFIEFFWLCIHPLYAANRMISKNSQGAAMDFHSVLENPKTQKLFAEHLANEWSVENLKFWNQVETFRNQYSKFRSKKETNLVAWQMYVMFIRQGAVLDINIPFSIREKLVSQFEKIASDDPELGESEIPASIFDAAQHEVYQLMEKDSFQRFVQSKAFKQFATENIVVDPSSNKLVVVADPVA